MLNRRSFSDVLPESPKSARKKEEARQAEFVRIGQVKKFIQIPSLHWERSKNKNIQNGETNENESLYFPMHAD